jgi:hypothetical protein
MARAAIAGPTPPAAATWPASDAGTWPGSGLSGDALLWIKQSVRGRFIGGEGICHELPVHCIRHRGNLHRLPACSLRVSLTMSGSPILSYQRANAGKLNCIKMSVQLRQEPPNSFELHDNKPYRIEKKPGLSAAAWRAHTCSRAQAFSVQQSSSFLITPNRY